MDDNQNSKEVLLKIRAGITNLAEYVDTAWKGVQSLESTVKVSTEKFPEASTHLKKVTGDLENAANNLMTLVEGLMSDQDAAEKLINEIKAEFEAVKSSSAEKAARLKALNDKMKSSTMDLLTGMSFHDLSGQKIKKVVATLSAIEKQVRGLASTFGYESDSPEAKGDLPPVNQNEVDRIIGASR